MPAKKKERRPRSELRQKQEAALREKGWVTVREAEATYGIPKATIYSWLRAERIAERETSWVGNKQFVLEEAIKTLAGPLAQGAVV